MKRFDTFIRHATLVWMDKYFYRERCLGATEFFRGWWGRALGSDSARLSG
jgi:hypothetical protein